MSVSVLDRWTLVDEEGVRGKEDGAGKGERGVVAKGPLEPRLVRSVSLGPRAKAEGAALNGSAVVANGHHAPDAS